MFAGSCKRGITDVDRQHRPGKRRTSWRHHKDVEAHQSQASGPGDSSSRRRRDHGRQVLRHVPHPGLLPALQETQGAHAEDASARTRTHQRTHRLHPQHYFYHHCHHNDAMDEI